MARAQDHNYEGRKEKSSSRLGTEVKRGCGILRGGCLIWDVGFFFLNQNSITYEKKKKIVGSHRYN
jgi:hypothetical protein